MCRIGRTVFVSGLRRPFRDDETCATNVKARQYDARMTRPVTISFLFWPFSIKRVEFSPQRHRMVFARSAALETPSAGRVHPLSLFITDISPPLPPSLSSYSRRSVYGDRNSTRKPDTAAFRVKRLIDSTRSSRGSATCE